MGSLRVSLLLLAGLLWLSDNAEAGCSESHKCCNGRDHRCSSTGWRMDRVYGTCYCDEACKSTGDCCYDYIQTCPASPCVVSEWSHWSGCAEQCHPTMRIRRRHIEQEPQNHGDLCPPLEERAGCLEYMNYQGVHCGQSYENRPFARWMQYLREGYTVCVTCQPPAMNSHNHRCHGDGASDKGTHIFQWQAVGNSQCRGTWKKVREVAQCSCPIVHSFIFT
ncbi:somatomedin-B and thrombospondin type-1 domain-containing protein isoform X2 [Carcharodon carcharias]|uniref:somatomedin-B and thrombospondin type-1 domain-containing protein isoform X2 n=1 Tax=Carcharodon carcharias TaxID=13397 RepID=UPI001B7EF256|nr:somatomedin-B and thrombospondin type-1 domain-containing protein isoform X2 [Carcharodon carcharias]